MGVAEIVLITEQYQKESVGISLLTLTADADYLRPIMSFRRDTTTTTTTTSS